MYDNIEVFNDIVDYNGGSEDEMLTIKHKNSIIDIYNFLLMNTQIAVEIEMEVSSYMQYAILDPFMKEQDIRVPATTTVVG